VRRRRRASAVDRDGELGADDHNHGPTSAADDDDDDDDGA